MVRIEEQFIRIYKIVGCNTRRELAEILGVGESAVSDAMRRGAIPEIGCRSWPPSGARTPTRFFPGLVFPETE